ncbi:general substrate transporter [Penicillium taxi]|uniref:general substrate transporter n=1 Tax=Penicillium taxi TaxID=168475 RepID=UPI0025454BF5|nr:general substrate transporter [Penicillium taxi]KAJ5885400.1 general substrate transporter [Penicillium taxi]
MTDEKHPVCHEEPLADMELNDEWSSSLDAARAASTREHKMSVGDAVKLFPWALLWALIPSMAIVMEGYDTILIPSFYAYPAFQKQFGSYDGVGYQVSGQWQSALGAASNVGSFIGALVNGYLVNRLGFKKIFMLGQVLMCAFTFVPFFGQTIQLQVIGQVLCGIPWGMFATLGPAYSSELCPMALRPYLTACVNMYFVIGQLVSAGVLQGLINMNDQWSYRIPLALQWMLPAPLLILGCFMPESPWWYVRQGDPDSALKIVNRLMVKPDSARARETVAMMIHTDQREKEVKQGSYMDCFRGHNARRTEIACIAFVGQVFSGLMFAYSPTYFFEQAGMTPAEAYKLGLGGSAVAFTATVISAVSIQYFPRRTLYVGGMGLLSIYLLIVGCLTPAVELQNKTVIRWTQSALCIVWIFTFAMTVGPMAWLIPPEVSSTRLRSKTIALARNSYYVAAIAASVVEPYMMNPTDWNWRGYTGFFWFATAFATFVWSYFRLPETKGFTYEELDIMFAARVPTREFSSYQVDAYAEGSDEKSVLKR